MDTMNASHAARPSRVRRFLRFPLTRMIIAIFVCALAGGLTLTYADKVAAQWAQVMWPEMLAAAATLLAYAGYVRVFERRPVDELAGRHAFPELGLGLLAGAVLVTRPGNGLSDLTMASVTRVEPIQVPLDPKAPMTDTELVRYLDAHQQFPGTPALGPAPGFLRSATYEPTPSR